MEIDVVAIGDEVLYGYTQNSNASFISQQLLNHGFLPCRHEVVGDDPEAIKNILQEALCARKVVITTGGLGPTLDDWTRKVAATLFGVELAERVELRQQLEARYGKEYLTIPNQSELPEGAILLPNELGTASGFILQDTKRFSGAVLISLPGVPHEMKEMFSHHVLPFLRSLASQPLFLQTMHFVGMREHELDPLLRTLKSRFPGLIVGVYPGYFLASVHLGSRSKDEVIQANSALKEQFERNLIDSPSGTLAEAVHLELLPKGCKLATAESCTGGALSAALVQYPDASKYHQGGVVAYSNEVKMKVLGVDENTLQKHGAVSEEVTHQMAQNVQRLMQADIAIAVSGIMGPKGGQAAKPVGTVCFSLAYKDLPVRSWTIHLRGNRQMLIDKTVQHALSEIYLLLRKA